MCRHRGKCPGCGQVGPLTRHHILPVRFYGRGNHNDSIALLCAECHRDLERTIPTHPQLPEWEYYALVAKFIKENRHECATRFAFAAE